MFNKRVSTRYIILTVYYTGEFRYSIYDVNVSFALALTWIFVRENS